MLCSWKPSQTPMSLQLIYYACFYLGKMWMVHKLNVGKAYGHVNWEVLIYLIRIMGFGKRWIISVHNSWTPFMVLDFLLIVLWQILFSFKRGKALTRCPVSLRTPPPLRFLCVGGHRVFSWGCWNCHPPLRFSLSQPNSIALSVFGRLLGCYCVWFIMWWTFNIRIYGFGNFKSKSQAG